MKYIINHKIFILFLTVIWCILYGSFSILTIAEGFLLSSFSVFISCHIPGGSQFLHSINISFFMFIKFIFILFIDIYSSTFSIFKLIFTSNISPRLVPIKTTLNNEWSIFLLANAITLTPGTVTVNRKGNKLLILTTYPEKSEKIINKKLVKALRKGVKH
ncbi:Na+/H+ antiporter subunit E [Vallitalea sp.]|uniref:Na+/H+ antiporter subunit E n=1 Tax=Vallitalea sp. TaxID=1882829 RepID=UPI0025F30340|nr:Na+/H+ antiporter subunit E [Vallitalea sp.]MCT4686418.1 Na+/H+ antiporter subunit E [Vallitalea sp.]